MYNICAATDRMILQLSDRQLLSLTLFPTLLLFASLLTISYAIDCNSRPAYTSCVEDMEQRVSEVQGLPSNPCTVSQTICMYYDYTAMYTCIIYIMQKLHFTKCRIGKHFRKDYYVPACRFVYPLLSILCILLYNLLYY